MEQLNVGDRRRFKDDLYEAFSRVGKALGSPKRLEILDLLAQRERTVQGLAEEMDVSVANASQHLQTLKDAKLVSVRRAGNYAHYRLADPAVFELWRALRDLSRERLPEIDALVEDHLGDRDEVDLEDPTEIPARAESGELVLLDVRPQGEYEWAHLPHAVSIPVDEVEDRADELPDDRPILVYCRGPFCTYSDEAVTKLREMGLDAHRMEPGAPDWALTDDTEVPLTTEAEP